MAVTVSGLYVGTIVDIFDVTQLAADLDSETMWKMGLFNNSITPNFDTDTSYAVAPYNANEVTGTNWAAGGIATTSTTFLGSSGTASWSVANVSVATTTISGARCSLHYADSLSPKRALVLVNFGADYATVAGTFAITWTGSTVFSVDVTP